MLGHVIACGLAPLVAASFDSVRLWTEQAASFYERLGFERVYGPKATHVYSISSVSGPRSQPGWP